jgi:small conductance mechanosensitive channel
MENMDMQSAQQMMDLLIRYGTEYGLKVIGAIVILIVGRIAAGIGRNLLRKGMARTKVDEAVTSFLASLVYIAILTFAILAALAQFGIQTASFVAVLGAAAFAVGFALQGSLANFAAGVMILLFRPFRIGDFVEAGGVMGTIKDITLFTSVLATPDNIRIIVPNGQMTGGVIKNFSANDTRRVDLVIGIGYGSSIQKAAEIMQGLLEEDKRILADPAPTIAVAELGDSSVDFVVRPWVKKEDYWNVRFDFLRNVKERFDAEGIEIPFPQRTVHMVTEQGPV